MPLLDFFIEKTKGPFRATYETLIRGIWQGNDFHENDDQSIGSILDNDDPGGAPKNIMASPLSTISHDDHPDCAAKSD